MKKHFTVLAPLIFFASISVAEELPQRKAGLWEVKVVTDQPGAPSQEMKQCTDAGTDAQMMNAGNDMAGKMGVSCTKPELKKSGSTYSSTSVCTMGTFKVTSDASFSGDFTSQYHGEVKSKFEPQMMGIDTSKTTITGKWIGPCEAGQVPGDMIYPGGKKFNFRDLEKLTAPKPSAAG